MGGEAASSRKVFFIVKRNNGKRRLFTGINFQCRWNRIILEKCHLSARFRRRKNSGRVEISKKLTDSVAWK
jgi:hypothetical protein